MAKVPVFVLAGQSNVAFGGIDNRLYELASAQGSDFAIVKVAKGGASLYRNPDADWAPSSHELFDQLVSAISTTVAGIIAAGGEPEIYTFWVQGERDADRLAYGAQLSAFIAKYRIAIEQPASAFVLSLLPYSSPARDGQFSTANTVANVTAVDPVGATTWDGIHYEKPTREALAELFFSATGLSIGSLLNFNNHLDDYTETRTEYGFVVNGSHFSDFIYSRYSAPVQIRTYSGDDVITTGSFDDTILTGDNNDTVRSGRGNDRINLGAHDDAAWAGAGNDWINGGAGRDRLMGQNGNDILIGGTQADLLRGGNGKDFLDGGDGNDRLEGGAGNDRLIGGAGDDLLWGGRGADRLEGGDGADRFVFIRKDFTGNLRNDRDTILDFNTAAGDVINLSAIDANLRARGNNAFKFLGVSEFHKVAGELVTKSNESGLTLLGDTNGDGMADLSILLLHVTDLAADSILL